MDDGDDTPTPAVSSSVAVAPDDAEPLLPRNNWRSVLLRLGISIAFLVLLFWRLPDVSLDEVVPDLGVASVAWIVVAVLVHVVAYVLQTLRWATVSETLGNPLPFRRLFSHLLAGEFVSNALPTSFGGDVVRVVRQGRDTGDFPDAFAATAIERLSGWIVLPLISTAAMLAESEYLSLGGATVLALVINAVTVAALLTLLWVAGHERGAGRLIGVGGWRRYIGAVHLGVVAFRAHPGRVVQLLVRGLGFQVLQCVSVYAAARALELDQVSLLAAMAFFPPSAIAQNLPIAMGGLGVREAAFVLFFGAIGVPDGSAIALGLLVYVVFILASLAGAPSFAFGRRRGPDAIPAQR